MDGAKWACPTCRGNLVLTPQQAEEIRATLKLMRNELLLYASPGPHLVDKIERILNDVQDHNPAR